MFKTFAVLLTLSTLAIAVSPSDFKASESVQSGVSKFIAKIEQNIKAEKDVLGKFPATQDVGVTVHINGDIPVTPSSICLIGQGGILFRIGNGN